MLSNVTTWTMYLFCHGRAHAHVKAHPHTCQDFKFKCIKAILVFHVKAHPNFYLHPN